MAVPVPHLIGLALLLAAAALLFDYLLRARRVRQARLRRLKERLAQLNGERHSEHPRSSPVTACLGTSGQAARAGAAGPTPASPRVEDGDVVGKAYFEGFAKGIASAQSKLRKPREPSS